MRNPLFLVIALALMAACSEDEPPSQAAATPSQAAPPADAQRQQPATATADMAAAEATGPDNAADPCDLRGYDMSKMTVQQHEELVKLCNESKQ